MMHQQLCACKAHTLLLLPPTAALTAGSPSSAMLPARCWTSVSRWVPFSPRSLASTEYTDEGAGPRYGSGPPSVADSHWP